MTKQPTKSKGAGYVKASRDRAILDGAISTPRGMLPPDAASALRQLMHARYGHTRTACIVRALQDAAERIGKRR